ncbi:MAG: hypothetical protein P8Z38_03125 [Robiginitalea sp.]|jgi:hypothetical protein
MRMRHLQWFASLFLLLIFLGSKSMEYHTATHMDGDTPDCEWCDYALLLHATPFEPTAEIASETPPGFIDPGYPDYSYSHSFISRELSFRNFSRPPPQHS